MTPVEGPEQGPPARLLDLTRLLSRIGRGRWTGIDRVELAYLEALLADPVPLFALLNTGRGYLLLDETATRDFARKLQKRGGWGRPDLRQLLAPRSSTLPWKRRRAEAGLSRRALAFASAGDLPQAFVRHLPAGTALVNVGHANLRPAVFRAMEQLPDGRISVLVHDMIPLDHPEWQTPGIPEKFERQMRRVSERADLVICNSSVTRDDSERHFARFGRVPPMIVAPLGIERLTPIDAELPPGLDLDRPYFVILGTIEPRKNHALLLDVWEHFATSLPAQEIPALYIVGVRGWANEALFERIDNSPLTGRHVFELSDLTDGAVAALIEGASALLMPSHAEGFGLPPSEALALGTPVIANPLPVYWEIVGNNPVYADVGDMYLWATKILELARAGQTGQQAMAGSSLQLPTWQEHFNLVLKVT